MIICVGLVTTPTFACVALTDETDPVIASRRCDPYPVTTTGSSSEACGASPKCTSAVPPGVTATDCCCGAYPIKVTRTTAVPAGTSVNE